MIITTNRKPRELIYGYQLTEKEYQDFDYLGEYGCDDMQMAQFIRYKCELYYLGDFVRIEKVGERSNSFTYTDWDGALSGWDGILTDSYFSAIVIKWADDDFESAVVGRVSC
jgi:hypothetical protein